MNSTSLRLRPGSVTIRYKCIPIHSMGPARIVAPGGRRCHCLAGRESGFSERTVEGVTTSSGIAVVKGSQFGGYLAGRPLGTETLKLLPRVGQQTPGLAAKAPSKHKTAHVPLDFGLKQ